MAIVGSCGVCGRVACTSGRHQDGKGITFRGASRRGLPLSTYTNAKGETLRLNEPDARRMGLIGPEALPEPDAAIIEPDGAPVDRRAGEVLSWAGDDPGRLQEALDAERAGKNRTTLTAELERRLADGR